MDHPRAGPGHRVAVAWRAGPCRACGDQAGLVDATQVAVVLVIWAERFAVGGPERMQRVLYGIADRLALQHDLPALTLRAEISELRSRGERIADGLEIG